MGASRGMNTVAAMPSSRAAQATACPWFPALAAMTPAVRSASPSVDSLFTAPRILNDPVRWRFSAFSQTLVPVSRENVPEPYTGVTRARPARRSRAASMSASVGAVVVANAKHLLQDLTNGRQGGELPFLHLVEQPAELVAPLHGILQMATRARRSDLEHLGREVAAAAALELTLALEPRPVLDDLLPQGLDPLTSHGLGEDDRRAAAALHADGEDEPPPPHPRPRAR